MTTRYKAKDWQNQAAYALYCFMRYNWNDERFQKAVIGLFEMLPEKIRMEQTRLAIKGTRLNDNKEAPAQDR